MKINDYVTIKKDSKLYTERLTPLYKCFKVEEKEEHCSQFKLMLEDERGSVCLGTTSIHPSNMEPAKNQFFVVERAEFVKYTKQWSNNSVFFKILYIASKYICNITSEYIYIPKKEIKSLFKEEEISISYTEDHFPFLLDYDPILIHSITRGDLEKIYIDACNDCKDIILEEIKNQDKSPFSDKFEFTNDFVKRMFNALTEQQTRVLKSVFPEFKSK